MVAPAFLCTGRTVVDGLLRVDGVALGSHSGGDHRTLFAGSGPHTEIIRLEVVRRRASAVVAAYTGRLARDADVICCDAVTEYDLESFRRPLTNSAPGYSSSARRA
jgi:uncharacterized protein YgbK (DUF1537 family)